jgi:hypothetical protein
MTTPFAIIDVGCARYGNDYSIERLIEEFHPDVVYGFDPSDEIVATAAEDWERIGHDLRFLTPEGVGVILEQKAAWTYSGKIGYRADGLNSWISDMKDAPRVPCFDLSRFILDLAEKHARIVLKIDAEGSEYDLLKHLMVTGADQFLELAWIEWHEPNRGRHVIEEEFACPVKEWRW